MSKRPIEIHGYAIVSDDDKIADANGEIPLSMRNDKDWEQYQAALAASDLVVFARVSHENEPNTRGDPRVVVSRDAKGLEQRPDAWWWNPAERRVARGGCASSAGRRRSRRAGRAGRVRSVPGHRLRRVPPRAGARGQAARRPRGVLGMRRRGVGRGGAGASRAPPRRTHRARPGEGRRDEYLARDRGLEGYIGDLGALAELRPLALGAGDQHRDDAGDQARRLPNIRLARASRG